MTTPATPFDLRLLYRAIDVERAKLGLTWAALSRHVGVAASTIRRFEQAADAEADGVLALIAWLETAPEDYVVDNVVQPTRLSPSTAGFVRVDMALVAAASCEGQRGRSRTTIQRLVAVAQSDGRSVASLTRLSDI